MSRPPLGNQTGPAPAGKQKHRSVGENLKRAKSTAAKRQTALNWAADWKHEQETIISRIKRALETGERGFLDLDRALAEMEAITAKRLGALPRVIELLLEGVEDEEPTKP